jgi:hypothetical protein
VNLVVQWQDGTLPTPVLLGEDSVVHVSHTFTGSANGKWMLVATGENYTAMTKPCSYDCYEVLDTSGDDNTEITPSQYEQFVAVCLQYFNGANAAMQTATEQADAAAGSAEAAERSNQDAATEAATATKQAKIATTKAGEAADSKTAAAGSATNAAESERVTAGYLDQAKAIVTGCQGWYATGEALAAAVPTGEKGWWAIVGETDTIWVWSSGDGTWKDGYHKVAEATSRRYTITVPASGWITNAVATVDGDSTTYTNTVEVEGITADTQLDCIKLAPEYMDNADAVTAFQTWSYLDTAAGSVVFYSATKPGADFAITALEVR